MNIYEAAMLDARGAAQREFERQANANAREAAYQRANTHPIMEHNGPANIVTLCRDIREGRRPYGPEVLDMIENNAARTIAYMEAWQKQPGIPWHNVEVQ